MSPVICFVTNHFEPETIEFYADVARNVRELGGTSCHLLTLTSEAAHRAEATQAFDHVSAVQEHIGVWAFDPRENARRVRDEFPDVRWSEVVASERAFTDYSALLGGGGDRVVNAEYVWSLIALLGESMKLALSDVDLVVCQSPDTLFSMVAIQVSKAAGIPCRIPVPAWITPAHEEAGFFATDEFLHSPEMLSTFKRLEQSPLDDRQRAIAKSLRDSILGSGGGRIYSVAPGRVSGLSPLSPHVRHPIKYLRNVRQQDSRIRYTRPDVNAKVLTNVKRSWRKLTSRRSLQTIPLEAVPKESVFLPLHFQPEQSTLAQGVWSANQVAFVENVSKALPWGYTLIVKEHSVGRGSRPRWQYRHLQRLYNVEFCDAPAREIMERSKITVTVSGTAALESLVIGRPVVMAGGNFFDYFPGVVRCSEAGRLPMAFAAAAELGNRFDSGQMDLDIDKALVAYAENLIHGFPFAGRGREYGTFLMEILGVPLKGRKGNSWRT